MPPEQAPDTSNASMNAPTSTRSAPSSTKSSPATHRIPAQIKWSFARVQSGRPEPVRSLEPEAPPELAAICEKALRADPEKRYQTARELAEDVQRFLAGAVVGAYAYSPWQNLQRLYRRHRTAVRVGMAAAAILAGGLAYYNIRLHQSHEAERRQRLAVEERTLLREEAYASA